MDNSEVSMPRFMEGQYLVFRMGVISVGKITGKIGRKRVAINRLWVSDNGKVGSNMTVYITRKYLRKMYKKGKIRVLNRLEILQLILKGVKVDKQDIFKNKKI